MTWQHHEVRSAGAITLMRGGIPLQATYEIGIISTGKTWVFDRHFVRVVFSDGQISGAHKHSLRAALRDLRDALFALKIELFCVGLDLRWVESGLSVDTGWGYWEQQPKPVHIMNPIPCALSPDAALDAEIREAVAGMRIGFSR